MDYDDVPDREEYPRNAPADDSDDFVIPIELRKVVVLQPFLSSYQEWLFVKDPIACIAKPFPDIQEKFQSLVQVLIVIVRNLFQIFMVVDGDGALAMLRRLHDSGGDRYPH